LANALDFSAQCMYSVLDDKIPILGQTPYSGVAMFLMKHIGIGDKSVNFDPCDPRVTSGYRAWSVWNPPIVPTK